MIRPALARVRRGLRGDSRPGLILTGGGGVVGGILKAGLSADYAVRSLDSTGKRGVDVVANMSDAEEAASAFLGCELAVDLAANSDTEASWQAVHDNNLPATLNAFEAARSAGVRRVVFASSSHVVGGYEHDEPYASVLAGKYDGLDAIALPRLDDAAPIRPDGPYAVGKAFGEAAGRLYSEKHGISVICLRIGTVNRSSRPTNPRHFATLLTHRDLVQLVRLALAAPATVRFAILYGVSANTWRIWDIERARELIGYAPRDNAERWR